MVSYLPSWFGRLLRGMRAGTDGILFNDPALAQAPASITVQSAAFDDGGNIPRVHTSDGDMTSPPLAWHGVPAEAAGLVLLIEDADSPTPSPFVHLVAWGAAQLEALASGDCKGGANSAELQLGRNGLLRRGYTPPDPPPGHGAHRYFFQVFALSQMPVFGRTPSRGEIARTVRTHAIAKGMFEGRYERP
ncbi:MAG: YbhB/YbcL family Raf kinase inhibitor-like protein [Pseudomonas sp.]|uniref:YbhB/YbcL family Raf kinase inhibitor-like protein n=1 Tax=Pseudomonas sp. TaxID=306 RepID=UPI00398209B9